MKEHTHTRSPSELLHEAAIGRSEETPFLAITGAMIIIGLAVLAVLTVVAVAIFIA